MGDQSNDWTSDELAPDLSVRTEPSPDSETRRHLALGALGLYAVILLMILAWGIYRDDSEVVLGVMAAATGVTGPIVGFYFGRKAQ